MTELPINKIICGDALTELRKLPDECVDCVITSPPYDNMRSYKGFSFDFEGIAKEIFRILKLGGVCVWVVGDQSVEGDESGTSFRQALYFKSIGMKLWDTMIYEKNGTSFPSKDKYYQNFEFMFVLSKGKPKTVNLIADRKNKWIESWGISTERQKDGSLKKKKKIIVKDYGVRWNIWKINNGFGYSASDDVAYEHPAIFPEALVEGHIITWTKEGELVLDPFLGSGTTCKVAKKLGRNYIGIDISKDYCAIAEKRLYGAPVNLFNPIISK